MKRRYVNILDISHHHVRVCVPAEVEADNISGVHDHKGDWRIFIINHIFKRVIKASAITGSERVEKLKLPIETAVEI